MDPQSTEPPIACTLGADDARAQLQEWASLRALFRTAEPTARGVHLWFDAAAAVPLRAVAAEEAACCAFLRFGIVNDRDLVRLEVTSDQSDALPVIALLTALVSGSAPSVERIPAKRSARPTRRRPKNTVTATSSPHGTTGAATRPDPIVPPRREPLQVPFRIRLT